ncbi:MAG: response regulator, partial [Alphaproteobacteria bacterium]|nr:response regulator [Alphaproteobacteria bacterium]
GKEALEAVHSGRYGILITDLHMPEVDGYQLVERIRKEEEKSGKHFPVIVLTADVQMAQRETYMRYGFDECLLKPVSLGQFKRLLIRWGLLKEEEKIEETKKEEKLASGSAVDRDAMIEQMGAFDDNAIEMLGMFVEMTAPLIDRVKNAFAHGDQHDLAEAAHSLKGAARSACCNALGDVAARLQDESEKLLATQAMIDDVLREFARAEGEIKALQSDTSKRRAAS